MTKHREGLAMLEMLIAFGLGLVILLPLSILLSTSLLFQSKQENIFVMEQDGYRLLDLIEQALLQAGQVHPLQFEQDASGADGTGGTFGALSGLDNAIISGTSHSLEGKTTSGFHGSDALAVHFAASETEEKTDIVNCAGNSVSSFATDNQDRRWSIFILYQVVMAVVICAVNTAALINGIRNPWPVEWLDFSFFMVWIPMMMVCLINLSMQRRLNKRKLRLKKITSLNRMPS